MVTVKRLLNAGSRLNAEVLAFIIRIFTVFIHTVRRINRHLVFYLRIISVVAGHYGNYLFTTQFSSAIAVVIFTILLT